MWSDERGVWSEDSGVRVRSEVRREESGGSSMAWEVTREA